MEWNNEHKRGCKTAHGERHKMMDIHCSQPVHFQRQMQIIAFSFISHCRLLTHILLSSLKSKFSTEKCLCGNNVNPIETAKCTLIYITRHGQMIILLLPTEDSIHTEIANRSKSSTQKNANVKLQSRLHWDSPVYSDLCHQTHSASVTAHRILHICMYCYHVSVFNEREMLILKWSSDPWAHPLRQLKI